MLIFLYLRTEVKWIDLLGMRYYRLFLSFLLILFCPILRAQSLSVESFRLLETDLTANTRGTMERDQNGEVAALIKVVTSETGFVFDGGMMGIVKTVQKTGEVWVYVPRAIQKITITHQQHGVLRDYFFPISVEGARTYEMVLRLPNAAPVSNRNRAQFVVFNVKPQNAVILVDNEAHTLNSEGQFSVRLNPGEHSYMVTAPSYETEVGTVTVGNSRVVKDVNLSSLLGQLTIVTDDDAELYLDDEYLGYGSWSGQLNEGVYYVEVRRDSYKAVFQEVSVRRSENREVSVRATMPAFGDLVVLSDPLDFDIYIDGAKMGVTPDYIEEVRAGFHTLTFRKEGFYDHEISVNVLEDSVSYVSESDFMRIPESAREKKKREAQEAKAAKEVAKAAEKAARNESRQTEEEAKDAEMQYVKDSNIYDRPEYSDVLEVADVMPVFPGGDGALIQYFKDNFSCPQYYKGYDRVIVTFIVEKDGYVSDPYVVKGIDDVIDHEAIRVIKAMPKWIPGTNNGNTARVWQTVNINLRNKNGATTMSSSADIEQEVAKSSDNYLYFGGFYEPLEMVSYGGNIGFYINNFNVQADFGVHNREIVGAWKTLPSSTREYNIPWEYVWKFNFTTSLKMGYKIKVARPINIVPQVGLALTQLKSVNDESLKFNIDKSAMRTYCLGVQGAAKIELLLSKHLSLFVSPSYTLPFKLGDTAKRLDDNDKSVTTYSGGFKVGAGIHINIF